MSETPNVSSKPVDVSFTARREEGRNHWDVEVFVNQETICVGTCPDHFGILDIAADALYGDKNDWLNGSRGYLGDLLNAE